MSADVKMRVGLLLLAALLVGSAAVARVWLAASGSYSQGASAMPLRVASAVALLSGFALAGAAVAWPMPKSGVSRERGQGADQRDPS